MELTVTERLVLLQLLPQEGDYTTLKIVRRLREELSFDEGEHAALGFVQDGERIHWNPETDLGKEIDFGGKAHSIVVDKLEELNKKGALREEHVPLYEKFGLGD